MVKQAHIYIIGQVIGVGFRAWTKKQAETLGVTGWVKNSLDKPGVFGPAGGVETVIQGEEEVLDELIEALKKGKPSSRVKKLIITFESVIQSFSAFDIVR